MVGENVHFCCRKMKMVV